MTLDEREKKLASEIGFPEEILIRAKEVGAKELRKLELAALIPADIYHDGIPGTVRAIDREGAREVGTTGLYLLVPTDTGVDVALRLRDSLSGTGYTAFLLAAGYNRVDRLTILRECASGICDACEGLEIVGVLRTSDPYDLLRIRLTNATNYDMGPKEIIDKLKSWEELCSFDIIGAGFDWVHILFRDIPADLVAFARDAYDFCPDTMDQGYVGSELPPDADRDDFDEAMDNQTLKDFARWIEKNRMVCLWWD
ncbi:MAG: DUF4253 domain-containing protein [Pseudomonadota bacterium]